jgi:hypothetical protein
VDWITVVKSHQVRKILLIVSSQENDENDIELHLYTAGSLTTASFPETPALASGASVNG